MNPVAQASEPASGMTSKRRRVLFIAEAVSLAHMARPFVLAQWLDPARYEVCLAADSRYDHLFPVPAFERLPLNSISSQSFLEVLAKGKPIYRTSTLRRYVEEDLDLFRAWSPDLIVGDFRLSLAVSAREAGIPYVTITNAYWSPYARQRYPIPEHVTARLLGVPVAQALFRVLRPAIFAGHTIPLNRVRRTWGQSSLGLDLRRVYTDADHVLYADIPDYIDMPGLPDTHRFLGAILWSPRNPKPDWWDALPDDRPLVYVSPGSSGDARLLPNVLGALAGMPVTIIAATAGRDVAGVAGPNIHLAPFLPGTEAAARADLVICNGGSMTTQQALVAGKPVLGICSNLDQYLNMQAVAAAGAGAMLRAGKANRSVVRVTVERLLADRVCREAAQRMADRYRDYDTNECFHTVIEQVITVTGREGGSHKG